MIRLKYRMLTLVALIGVALSHGAAHAADDPSIAGATRTGISKAMRSFVADQEDGGWLLHYDPVVGKLVRLKLVELREGIVRKGHFFVSCADFADDEGLLYDLDFLVVQKEDAYRVNQAIVHKVGGDKRKYHVEQRWPGFF